MLGPYFYNKTIRQSVAIFGTLFNQLQFRTVVGGQIKDIQRVPINYGPRERILARIDEEEKLEDRKIAIKLPRLSFEIDDISYDQTRQLNRLNKCVVQSDNGSTYSVIKEGVPFNLDFTLYIYARRQDEGLQILEQILPYFTPDYTVTAKNLDGSGIKTDIPITRTGVSMPDEYEGDFQNVRDILIWTVNFQMKIKLGHAPKTQGIIKDIDVNMIDMNDSGFLSEITYEADSQDDPSISDQFGNHVDQTNDDTFTP